MCLFAKGRWGGQPWAEQGARERSEWLTRVLWLYIILLNGSERHPILINNNSRDNLLSEAFRPNDIKFYRLILLWKIFIFILILTSTLSLEYGRNLRIRLPTECPFTAEKCTHPIIIDEQCLEPAPKAVKWLKLHFEPNHNISIHCTKSLGTSGLWKDKTTPLTRWKTYPLQCKRDGQGNHNSYLILRFWIPWTQYYNMQQDGDIHEVSTDIEHELFLFTNAIVLSAEAGLIPTDLYLEQTRDMAIVRWATALPDNNIATAFFPPDFPLQDSCRFPSHRRTASSKVEAMKPKTWDSTSFTAVQSVLPIDDIVRKVRLIFKKWPVARKPNIWSPPSGEECGYYDNTIKTVREPIYENGNCATTLSTMAAGHRSGRLAIHDITEVYCCAHPSDKGR